MRDLLTRINWSLIITNKAIFLILYPAKLNSHQYVRNMKLRMKRQCFKILPGEAILLKPDNLLSIMKRRISTNMPQ